MQGHLHHFAMVSVVGAGLSLPVDVEPWGPGDCEEQAVGVVVTNMFHAMTGLAVIEAASYDWLLIALALTAQCVWLASLGRKNTSRKSAATSKVCLLRNLPVNSTTSGPCATQVQKRLWKPPRKLT